MLCPSSSGQTQTVRSASSGGRPAKKSKAHDIRHIRTNAERLLLHLTTGTLPGASHHSIPMTDPEQLNDDLITFLG
jgi:hypothetical protein